MKETRTQMGRRAFLIELLFAMVAMGICAAICLAGFAHSNNISIDSRDETQAVVRVQTAIEEFKVNPAAFESASGTLTLQYYDSEWNKIDTLVKDGYYLEAYDCVEQQGLYSALFTMWSEDGMVLCSIQAKKYLPEKAREAGV